MKMLKMILKRLLQSVVIIFIVTLIVFLLMQMIPGNPVLNYLGAGATDEQIEYYTKLFGYDQPVMIQYFKWIGGLFRGEMGESIALRMDIATLLSQRLKVTLSLVLPAFCIAVVLGVTLGIIAAKNRGKIVDSVISVVANLGMSMPMFWFGMILIYVFGLKLHVLPTSGYVYAKDSLSEAVRHSVLPVAVLALAYLSQFCRQTRSSMLEVIRQDYVTTARAKGVSTKTVTFRHQLRNALIPIVTVMGSTLGAMVGGTVLVESVFVVPGMCSLLISSINAKDFMVVVNIVMIISMSIAVCNLAVDILYGIIDPRIRNS